MTINKLHDEFLQSSGICTDSRRVAAGNIFFALKGERFNGNVYAPQALESGAAYAVVDEPVGSMLDQRYVRVDDALATLQQLATHHRVQHDIPVLALTGSNGKTTTKELIAQVLGTTYRVHFTKGNLNNHIGVPLTLLAMPADTQIAIIEMGANHQREIASLCQIARPSHGLVTNVGKAHLEGFGGVEGVRKGKGELYDYLAAHDGCAFVNREEPHLSEMAGGCRRTEGYGSDVGQPVRNLGASPFLRVSFDDNGETFDTTTQLIGAYNYPNVLTAIAIGRFFKVGGEDIHAALSTYTPRNNRSQFVEMGVNGIILDAYNANPTSLAAALRNFAGMAGKDKTAIIGDMLELGEESRAEHARILQLAKELGFGRVITVGAEFAAVNTENAYPDIQSLVADWDWEAERGLFLIKGSRGMRLEKLLA